ncbi:unnamed protein product [Acanthoscelides obtectus]|uniref:Uncharacterized protein n=2 Tax=Acanthoscelides obtectus TaxID=200917 RepID=A0A9P0KRN2_ACAOB|nr:unnamed protein product [Acanthoscelides obtectus]CAK1625154.1 hypothetical protein AOBTE_LOCUS2996 [Acanthoscelides obtectus]
MGNSQTAGVRKSRSLPTSPEVRRAKSSAIPHKTGAGGTASSIPLPGSAIPARRCPPDKVRPVAGSSRSSSPALSMIPRGPTQQVGSPYQTEKATSNGQIQKNSMLDKLKLFKNTEKPVQTNGKRTSSSSGVSSARSERSDSSISLEPNVDLKPIRNTSRLKQTRPGKPAQTKNSPNATKKEVLTSKCNKTAVEVEKHAHKVANLTTTKLVEPKVKVTVNKEPSPVMKSHIPPPTAAGTGIPKPTAAIKGTSKIASDISTSSFKPPPSTGISRESSQVSLKQHKPAIAMVSPIKNESNMSESTNSSSTTGPSSDSSMICKASSESSSEHQSSSPSKKLWEVCEEAQQTPQSQKGAEKDDQHCDKGKEENISKESESKEDSLGHIKEEEREDSPGISIEPMRPLLRGYCSTLTLPSRQRHYHHKVPPDSVSDYCDISIANGYLSDGEILRNTALMDIGDGYLSEGGSVLYARRLQTMPAHLSNG